MSRAGGRSSVSPCRMMTAMLLILRRSSTSSSSSNDSGTPIDFDGYYVNGSFQFRRVTGQSHQSRHSQKMYSIMDFLLRYLHSSGSVPAQVRQLLCRRPSVIFRYLPTDIFGLFECLTVA
ncbi:hypothetical protein J6590_081288 [Homalodisca vitripennis]|nr:hypothetical protein J6590_081288 [Homalodisca vitripennis]